MTHPYYIYSRTAFIIIGFFIVSNKNFYFFIFYLFYLFSISLLSQFPLFIYHIFITDFSNIRNLSMSESFSVYYFE